MDWIIHLDTDELIHPAGSQEYSLKRLLSDVPNNVDMVIFPNYVSGATYLPYQRVKGVPFYQSGCLVYFRKAALRKMI